MKLSKLETLNTAITTLEKMGKFDEADELHNYFIKSAAKKKSKKKKNVPNNPSLWASCKAWAKRTFDVYPCVPLDSLALTKNGWAEYDELNIGDEILTYNQNIDKLEFKPILNLHFYEDAPTLKMSKAQTNFKIRCTPDHKWVLKTPNVKYPTNLVEAKNITKRMVLKTAAEVVDDVNINLDLSDWRKGDDWIKNVLSMSKPQLESFFASGIVYDGHDKGKSSLNRSTYGFSQKNLNHGLAMEIAAVLLGYRVSFKEKLNNSDMVSWTFIKRDSESTGNLTITEDENCDVWCPETENNTWVMKQGNIITITGNSAYANGAAAKRYKSKGGTWRKASIKNIVKTSQIAAGGQTFYEIGDSAKKLMSSINSAANNPTDKIDDYLKYYRNNLDSFNEDEQRLIEKTIVNATYSRARQGTFSTDVYQPYDVLGNEPEPIKPEPEPVRPEPVRPEPYDKWSGYMEMPYNQVIQTAKSWLLKGDKDNATSMINAVSVGSKELNDAQKIALKKHFERILFSFQEMGRQPSGVFENAYSDANNLLFNLKKKYNLQDKDLKIGSTSYGLIMNDINKYVSPVKNPDLTNRTKQIALQLLRTLSMDNRAK